MPSGWPSYDPDDSAAIRRLLRETNEERARLARLSLRIAGVQTQPAERRERLIDILDRAIGGGDLSLGRLGRITVLYREEIERDRLNALEIIDIATLKRTKLLASADDIGRQVQERIRNGTGIPGILLRERPHLEGLAPLVEAAREEELRWAQFKAARRAASTQKKGERS